MTNGVDRFGIKKLYQTVSNGREWFSKWDNGDARAWGTGGNDPDDSECITANKCSSCSYSTTGDGTLKLSGSPRIYIMDQAQVKNWHNVEITVYAQRISDSNISYGGIQSYARTNHFIDANICDDRGYGGRFTYDGRIDFEKETAHHNEGYVQTGTVQYWSGGMIKNIWIGYKYAVYDLSNGNVKLELYIDNTDGLNGGNWQKVTEFIDTGSNFGVSNTACKSGINPALRLTSSDIRPGSETGKPNLAIYFRSDGVGTNGLLYKKASIREITTTPEKNFDVSTINDVNGPRGVMVMKNTTNGTYTKDSACQKECDILTSI